MSRKLWGLVLSAVAAVVVLGAVGTGLGTANAQQAAPTPTVTPVTTGNITLVAISPELCTILAGAKGNATSNGISGTQAALDCGFLGDPAGTDLKQVADFFGNGDHIVQPSDFAGLDLDGNQVHQGDAYTGTANGAGMLLILAFVPNQGPVTFRTNAGVFVPNGTPAPNIPSSVDPVGQVYTCDTAAEDADCAVGAPSRDNVVIGRLRATFGNTVAPITPVGQNDTVTVTQSSTDSGTIGFRVVGEPRTLSFTTLETTIQDGAGTAALCPLATDANGFLGANGTPERSIVLAVAKDIDGNAVTGALIVWDSPAPPPAPPAAPTAGTPTPVATPTDTPSNGIAVLAAPLTPTLDLGAFGFGAPNIICGAAVPGTATVKAHISQTANGAILDPGALEGANASTTFTVVGAPSVISLTADPASLACDGVATSSVTAKITDAAGNPVAAGQMVNFNVQVVGSANPVNAKTDDKGVATSVISPLSTNASGVPVVVTAGSVSASILVSCSTASATPTPVPSTGTGGPTGGTGGTGGRPTGTITGPNTGTGGGTLPGGQPWWLYVIALSAFGLLTGSALVWTGARAKQQ